MGIYDREYVREESGGFRLGGDRTMVTNLILVNVGLYVVNLLSGGKLNDWMLVRADLLSHPWDFWTLLTAGFAHDPHDITHIAFNMLALWFFGRDVEILRGRMEFLRLYLTLVVVSSAVWVATQQVMYKSPGAIPMLGASGAVMGIVVIFIVHYPKRLIYIWGVLPIPGWAFGTIYILWNFLGAAGVHQVDGKNIAYSTHLAGAAFGFLYDRLGWNFGRLWPSSWSLGQLQRTIGRKPKRVHDPDAHGADLSTEVDRILEKISREGQDSLSAAERKTLERASRRYQQRRS